MEKEVVLKQLTKVIELWLQNKTMKINGESKENDVAPSSINGRTMLPLRFVSENLVYKIDWNAEKKIVKVYMNGIDTSKLSVPINSSISELSDTYIGLLISKYKGINNFLNPPATEEDISAIEEKIGIRLPEELRTIYLKNNGQVHFANFMIYYFMVYYK